MSDDVYDVFLSHAGQQKKGFVDILNTVLLSTPAKIKVFLDQHSLNPGHHGWETIVSAANSARVAVVVLSKEFV